jgi:ABC-type nitrate/sulfonate/bicarbonate transport system substrate-binding protein
MRRRDYISIAGASAFGALAGCTGGNQESSDGSDGSSDGSDGSSDGSDGESSKLTVTAGWCDVWTLGHYYVGQDKGWFQTDSLETNWKNVCASSDGVQAVVSGQLDLAAVAPTNVANAASKGLPLKVLAPLTSYSKGKAREIRWLSVADNGIDSPADWEGETVSGASFGTMMHMSTLKAAQRAGLDPDEDVEVVEAWGMDAVNAMQNGNIVSGALPASVWASLDMDRFNTDVTNYGIEPLGELRHDGLVLITSDSALENKSDAILEWLKGYARATEFINENPEESSQIWSEMFGSQRSVKNLWAPMDLEVGVEGDQVLADWMHEFGHLDKEVNYADYVDQSLTMEAREVIE